MPSGGISGDPRAISADGSTVVGGYIDGSTSFSFAFRWSGGATSSDLGFLGTPIGGTTALGVNSDGTVVVGVSSSQAFRWTSSGGIVGLGSLDPFGLNTSIAYGVSGDGTIVVGQSASAGFVSGGEAFRWTQSGGMVGLGSLDTVANAGKFSAAMAISTDGQVIVGQSTSDLYPVTGEAFRWQGGTMTGLGTLTGPGASSYSVANAVSANGSVVVGQSSSNTVTGPFGSGEAFRWTQAGGMQGLGALSPTDITSSALAVNGDGSVVVGFSQNSSFVNAAFRWTQATGMQSIATILTTAGVNVTNWTFFQATGVSADGTAAVGSGIDANGNPVGWIARFSPTMGTGVITPEIVARSFAGLGALTQSSAGKTDAQLSTQAAIAIDHACGSCAFVYGVGGTVPGDPFGAGALGFKTDIARDVAVGISFGAEAGRTKLVYDGSVDTRGGLASAFVARLPQTGLQLIAALTGERFDADINRGYLNGNSIASSSGSTKGYGYGAMVRAGWAFDVGKDVRLTPFASYSLAHAHFDDWTETTGVFPAQFSAIDQTMALLRLGGDIRYTFAAGTWMWGGLNWAHRLGDTAPDIAGTLIGLFPLSVPGATLDRDYAETTIGLRVPMGANGAVSGSMTAMASANDPVTYLGRIVASYKF